MNLPDFDEPFDPDASSKELWMKVPEAIRKFVEEHVLANLPTELQTELHDLHSSGNPIGSRYAFRHFTDGMEVRNLCREKLSDSELAIYCPFGGNWDNCYIGVLAAIGARRQ